MAIESENKAKLIERIQALFNLGDKSRNDNENEANAATSKAQELLQKYNLTMAEIIGDSKVIEAGCVDGCARESRKTSIPKWENRLCAIVGMATETHPYISFEYYRTEGIKGSRGRVYKMRFIGTEWDVAIAKELFNYLHTTFSKLANQKYGKDFNSQTSYLSGVCDTLYQRIDDQNKMFRKENQTNEKYALMVINKKDAIQRYMEKVNLVINKHEFKERKFSGSLSAYLEGQKDASKINLGITDKLPTP